ncbi:MAG: PTS sugar transporter subunit IIB [Anaerolineaceae bacterium]|nr:PTS sugar transporter subunit IIB [Anaerolineaceae bacterium]
MKNLTLTRIDDRLIHGQVVAFWMKEYSIDKILIIDDTLSKDMFMSRIYKAAAPAGVEVLLLDREEGLAFLKQEPTEKEGIFLIVKVPERIEELVNAGIEIPRVILGGMGARNDRKTFNRNVSASKSEIECFSRILAKGTHIVYQMIPSDKPIPIQNFIE